jgi:plastocyanin
MRTRAAPIVGILLGLALAGCSDSSTQAPTEPPKTTGGQATTASPPPANAGAIAVRVSYSGPSDVETIKINKDVKQCGTEARIARVLVGEGQGLANVVASVTGLEGRPTARTPQLDQRGCQFRPHVLSMQAGEVEILNSDGILHNIHTYSEANPSINKAQPGFKKVMTETFTKPEIIKVTCDVHSWMLGWLVVMPHPYFGVTDERGTTRIEGVPAGSHTVEVWHETLGKQTRDVTVKPGETTEVVVAMTKAG